MHFTGLDARAYYYLALTFIIAIILMVRALERSRVGRAWTAIREDEDAAELMGVPTFKYKLWAFVMGAGIGGLSGALFASYQTGRSRPTPSPCTLHPVPGRGRARRRGQHPRRHPRRGLVAYLPERFRGLGSTRVFWFGVALVVDDDLPTAGHLPESPAGGRARGPEVGEVLAAVTEADIERVEEGLDEVSLPAGELEGHHDD